MATIKTQIFSGGRRILTKQGNISCSCCGPPPIFTIPQLASVGLQVVNCRRGPFGWTDPNKDTCDMRRYNIRTTFRTHINGATSIVTDRYSPSLVTSICTPDPDCITECGCGAATVTTTRTYSQQFPIKVCDPVNQSPYPPYRYIKDGVAYTDICHTQPYPALLPNQRPTVFSARNFNSLDNNACVNGSEQQVNLQYRIDHSPTSTCYLKVWISIRVDKFLKIPNPRFPSWPVPECCYILSQQAPEFIDGPTYEWIGTGNPCFTDPTKPFDACENIIHSQNYELIPDANETLTPFISKYSYVVGYEPTGIETSGFPPP
jgi:hypothetical protein